VTDGVEEFVHRMIDILTRLRVPPPHALDLLDVLSRLAASDCIAAASDPAAAAAAVDSIVRQALAAALSAGAPPQVRLH